MSSKVAYFSMEIGIKPEIKTYSGGLGILAGDTIKSAADLGLDFTAVTLLYRNGYFKQVLEDYWQREEEQDWNPYEILEDTGKTVSVKVKGEQVDVKAWKFSWNGEKGEVDIYFLDTGLETNSEYAKSLTSQLYPGGEKLRLSQEVLLGIGGTRILEECDIKPDYFHMNEGHSALLGLEAEGEHVFTTHTPVPAGHDVFEKELVMDILSEKVLENLDIGERLNTTELALENSCYINAVSDKHGDVSEDMFPEHKFSRVTNGVHSKTWTAEPLKDLYDEYMHGWRKNPRHLSKALKIPDQKLWNAKKGAKNSLIEHTGKELDPDVFTVGFARRSTAYKRPTLIFNETEELERIAKEHGGLQLVYGGKAHPDDHEGKKLIEKILKNGEVLENVTVHFIEDYGMEDAMKLISGCDLWLNNPKRGQEASGTSGMKAAHNGTPQLSTLDGWWLEGHIEDVTGWAIGEDYVEGEDENRIDSKSLYLKLGHIMDLYHNEREDWLEVMKHCIAINASYFNTHRMVREYATHAYRN